MAILSPWCHTVCILPRGGGPKLGERGMFSDLERNRIYDLKANILKIEKCHSETNIRL